jgi:hypothetical protein
MNKETFERLKKYEVHLRRGYLGDYCYGLLSSDFEVLYGIYKELGGKENLKYTCNNCCLRLTKFLGKLYYAEKDKPTEVPPLPDKVVEEVLVEPNPLLLERVDKKEEKTKKTRKSRKKESQ